MVCLNAVVFVLQQEVISYCQSLATSFFPLKFLSLWGKRLLHRTPPPSPIFCLPCPPSPQFVNSCGSLLIFGFLFCRKSDVTLLSPLIDVYMVNLEFTPFFCLLRKTNGYLSICTAQSWWPNCIHAARNHFMTLTWGQADNPKPLYIY